MALFPLIVALGAGLIANAFSCELHEGFVNPCKVLGVDIGSQLYSAFVLGWLAILTIPIGFSAWLIHMIYGAVVYVRLQRSRRGA